jgi:ribosome-binding ATPase YchF (GTP1/OBG family)
MKISINAIPDIVPGKHNIKDSRLDEVDAITRAKKKTYIQVEAVDEKGALDSDAIIVTKENRTDLILRDLEFVETRLSRSADEKEKEVLNKFKAALEKEEFVSSVALDDAEKKLIAAFGLYTLRPVTVAEPKDLEDINGLLTRCVRDSGYISFFTTGEKETRAWLIKNGTTAWEAAGTIHSDIQQGFIRAEIISFADFISCGGESRAKQAGKLRLEQKDYVMQDTDLVNFRFNK